MYNPKLDALQRQRQPSHAERLLGKDAGTASPPPPLASAGGEVAGGEADVIRKCYVILRGRIEALPSLELRNRRGQTQLLPWLAFGGASLDHPGALVLFFDGPEGSCQITIGGRRLDQELLQGVKAQKVSLIQELDELTAAAVAQSAPAEPVVTDIWIVGGRREWSRGPLTAIAATERGV